MNPPDTIDAVKAQTAPRLTRVQREQLKLQEQAAKVKKLEAAEEEKQRKRQKEEAKKARKIAFRQAETARKMDTRLKILVGFAHLNAVKADPSLKSEFEGTLSEHVTEDRHIALLQHFGFLQHLPPAKSPAFKE